MSYKNSPKLRVYIARFLDACIVSFIVIFLAYGLDMGIHFSFDISLHYSFDGFSDRGPEEMILDQVKFWILYLLIWLLHELLAVLIIAKFSGKAQTIGMMCEGLAIFDSTEGTKANFAQLWKRTAHTLHRAALVTLGLLMVLGIEAIFLSAIFLFSWTFLSTKTSKGVNIDQKSGTEIRQVTPIGPKPRAIFWAIGFPIGAIIIFTVVISMCALVIEPLKKHHYYNQIEQICQSPSLAEYCHSEG